MKVKSLIMTMALLSSQLFVMVATAQDRNPALDEKHHLTIRAFLG